MASSSRDPTRLRLGLNPLTTSLGHFNGQHGTPISAVSMASTHVPPSQTPASAIQPYNPQEWVASPAVERQSQYLGDPQGHQAPLPPPPYSPPRSQQQRPLSSAFDQPVSTPTPPVPRIPSALHRPSPEPQGNVSFPPPPGTTGRGSSRERRFGIPSLTRRNREHDTPSTPESHGHFSNRGSPAPISFHTPEPIRPQLNPMGPLPSGPPAARRAVSAGAIETPTSARSRSGPQTPWDPNGMALPPPPPGPPPSISRSQSVQPLDRTTVPMISPPTRRPPTLSASALGPVPPTPADWVDDSQDNNRSGNNSQTPKNPGPGLTIDTEIAQNSDQVPEPMLSSSSNSGLSRTKAVRHDKPIMQRRAESRTRHSARNSIDEVTQSHAIANIIVPGINSGGAERGESSRQSDPNNLTPRSNAGKLPRLDTGATPFASKPSNHPAGSSIVPKALPTPPPQTRSASSMKARESSRPPHSATTPISKHLVITQSAEQFASGTIERFQAFAAQEAAATSDADRVRMFADFIVNESRVRRERYATAIGAMGSEIFDLTRDLFRPMIAERRASVVASPGEWTPDSSGPVQSNRGSAIIPDNGGPSSAPGSARLPPSPSASGQTNPNYNQNNNFMPSLSPILSMSVSDRLDGGSSRGRPSSRWWEADSQGDGSRRFERSKRESKYMGVPKDQWADVESTTTTSHVQSSEHDSSSDYPPEKTGFHDIDDSAAWTPQPSKFFSLPADSTPSPAPASRDLADVSRLVTLPPPYPRHHPAVNNNHPELTETRISVRVLSDMAEIKTAKEKFKVTNSKRRDEMARAVTERQQGLRANLQREISSGNLSYADAAAIEADAQTQENGTKKEFEKAEYELFQNEVIMPLNELLTGRINQATELYDNLAKGLFDNGQNDADMPQEEGDDRPELLEKLTLLKWIFEARESLHRAIYDLLSERNERFREVVITPYRLTGNTEKLRNAEAFFAEDSSKREFAFANEVLDRTRDFRGIVDNAVQRGVALQLSAFWDIAPPLSRLLESIPLDLRGFHIHIPLSEYDENPSYREHPMQYLLSLLLHTEKSTYQFIEAHTNLLCLLHEVKEAVVHAKARVLASQATEADGTPINSQQREERSRSMRETEGRRLTDDLKEKVRVVQDQWNNALAENITNVKERTTEWLLQTGGWDETILESGGIGGP